MSKVMSGQESKECIYTAAHWGLYRVDKDKNGTLNFEPHCEDPDPADIGHYLSHPDVEKLRVRKPCVRRGWLEQRAGKQGARRGQDDYVEVEWDEAIKLVSGELARVKADYGNKAIFAGSYGWGSAGKFHHAPTQTHRFFNAFGGFVSSKDSYSLGAASALMHWIVMPVGSLMESHTDWDTLAQHCELFVSFGGVPRKNGQVSYGGTTEHRVKRGLYKMAESGTRIINISPVKDNLDSGAEVEWWPIRPNTDTALMLGLMHSLWQQGNHDREFLERYCSGFEKFESYLSGKIDGQPKTAQWAAGITGLSADKIQWLANELSSKRSLVNMAWSLQRAHHGEQPLWALITLASMLGQIGLPGGGFGFGYGAENLMGSRHKKYPAPMLTKGINSVPDFIPVARIADMLNNPGETFSYQGKQYRYPQIRLVYWAGGNPFHHHQDLAGLSEAWQRPETIIAHEQYWTASAKMADIVLPATTSIERDDIVCGNREAIVAAMKKVQSPEVDALDDYTIFSKIAHELGIEKQYTEGRDAHQWLESMYDQWRKKLAKTSGSSVPVFSEFWQQGILHLEQDKQPIVMLEEYRSNPEGNPLKTPSGKIEVYSQAIADMNLEDCPGYACWIEPHEWLGSDKTEAFPLHMISDQPKNKLHSQLDHSPVSRRDKINGREPVYINPLDAKQRQLEQGDLVRVFNSRGSCLASVMLSSDIRESVIRLSTGAWFDPTYDDNDALIEKHGNPNALTADIPASSFSQGCSAQTCLVEIEKYQGKDMEVTAFNPPKATAM